jgi:hypothetical protein
MLYLETGTEKFKMAAPNRMHLYLIDVINRAKFHLDRLRGFGWAGVKPDVPVSQLLYKITKKFQRLSTCFWGQETQ